MRIVHILTRLLRAGSEENTLLNCVEQIAQGHEVYVLHGHDSAPEHARAVVPGLRLFEVPALTRELHPFRDAAAIAQTVRILRNIRPDIVHTHQSKAGIVGRAAAALARVPLVIHGVHILPFVGETGAKRSVYLMAERAAARVTDAFIHVSDGMKAACLEHGVGQGKPHYVVRSGFDLQRFALADMPDDWQACLGVATGQDKPPVIAMLAAMEPRKNHLGLVDALRPVFERFPALRLVLAGEGHLRDQIAAKIADAGLQDQVRLLGYRDDPERVIAMSDICVHCSDREGLPRSVLQYLAAGRPVVMFDLPGIDDVMTDGQNGIVVAHGDWSALADGLNLLLADTERRSALAKGARDTDLRRWDSTVMAQATLGIYAEQLADLQDRSRLA